MSSPTPAAQSLDGSGDLETQHLLSRGPVQNSLAWLLGETDRIMWLAMWMLVSVAVIVYNKWIFSAGGFPYPLALTCLHMSTCFLVFGSIRKLAPQSIRLFVMPDADVVTPWDVFIKNFVLISVFYAGTLGTGQMAYLFASIPFIQMMKPMNCIFASVAAFAIGMETPTWSHFIIVCIIAFGISLATSNATQFSTTGAVLQVVSSMSEGFRLALVQTVTTTGIKLDPVSTVYHFSFTSAVLLAIASFLVERPYDLSKLLSPWVLVLNCAMAVILNIIVATVIKKTSAVVFTLGGIVKDMGVIGASAIAFTTPTTKMMVFGYMFSLSGIVMYKIYKDNLELFKQVGFLQGMSTVGGQAKSKLRSIQ